MASPCREPALSQLYRHTFVPYPLPVYCTGTGYDCCHHHNRLFVTIIEFRSLFLCHCSHDNGSVYNSRDIRNRGQ